MRVPRAVAKAHRGGRRQLGPCPKEVYNAHAKRKPDHGTKCCSGSNETPAVSRRYNVNCVILWKCRARALISDRFSARKRSKPNFSTVKLPITEP